MQKVVTTCEAKSDTRVVTSLAGQDTLLDHQTLWTVIKMVRSGNPRRREKRKSTGVQGLEQVGTKLKRAERLEFGASDEPSLPPIGRYSLWGSESPGVGNDGTMLHRGL